MPCSKNSLNTGGCSHEKTLQNNTEMNVPGLSLAPTKLGTQPSSGCANHSRAFVKLCESPDCIIASTALPIQSKWPNHVALCDLCENTNKACRLRSWAFNKTMPRLAAGLDLLVCPAVEDRRRRGPDCLHQTLWATNHRLCAAEFWIRPRLKMVPFGESECERGMALLTGCVC